MVQCGEASQFVFNRKEFLSPPFDVLMELVYCAPDYFELMEDEVRYVVVITFCVQESTSVFNRRLKNNLRNGNELEEPIAVPKHRPVE